jgi:hypothetical protein
MKIPAELKEVAGVYWRFFWVPARILILAYLGLWVALRVANELGLLGHLAS